MTDHAHQLVKRFVAPTMTRALDLVQRELGPEAVILSSRRIDKGVEIVTSLEPDLPTRGIESRREFSQKFDADLDTALPSDSAWRSYAGIEKAAAAYGQPSERTGASLGERSPEELAREIERAREKMLAAKRQAESTNQRDRIDASHGRDRRAQKNVRTVYDDAMVSEKENARMASLQSEIADMRMLLQQQLWQMSELKPHSPTVRAAGQLSIPDHYSVVSAHLRRLGLSDGLAEELIAQLTSTTPSRDLRASNAWRQCMAILAKRLPTSTSKILQTPGVYAFLGQTGVGKTTTIAKLAAQFVLRHGPGKVALVTTDTYRVGAYDQLRTMGRILNVPVKVVDGENSLLTTLASLRQFPMILIDTAGFRLGDAALKAQLAQMESSPQIKRVLVMSCNSQLATMKASVHAHRGKRGLHTCVLTKLDECASLGEALSVIVEEQLPVAYTTDGQDIPKDISAASAHKLVAKAVAILKAYNVREKRAAL